MNKSEVTRVLIFLHADCGKEVSKTKIEVWAELLKRVPPDLGMAAAKETLKEKTYGEPQFATYREKVNALHRAAIIAARGKTITNPALLSHMSSDERDAYLAAQKKALTLSPMQAKKLLGDILQNVETKKIEAL